MVFKGLTDKFKYKSGVKYLKKELSQQAAGPDRPGGLRSIGVILDLDSFSTPEVFYEFIDVFKLRPNAVKIIGYKRFYDKNSPYATPVFSDKDLGWNGDIENSYALEFLGREYDLLINYYKEDNLMMKLMSVKAKATMRVGFAEIDPVFNDLILGCELKDFSLFRKELQKYLSVLKEWV
ncbi:hypothetical protein SAMN04490243_1658 [Robiginitalea myxolifaciens]|uniref:Uncharacterized protein n=1 Tax=Robiginitalea myxolifaciens TaxID=400055 RepID=A0A1I6GSL3_9FLAO|nr:hypothetical protein [Robiginitalea myxolifaciens]SFR45017.1 hypothetical protein SAMN04490243_1658 [Robiginitalea myxolifaciens]